MDDRNSRVAQALADANVDFAVIAGFDNLCYITGYAGDLESGPSPFGGGPLVAIVTRDGEAVLVGSNAEYAPAPRAAGFVTYEGFSIERDPDRAELYVATLASELKRLGVRGRVGIESTRVPLAVAELLRSAGATLVDVGPHLREQRAVKTVEEIALLRASAELAGVGQTAARTQVRSGLSEVEVFSNIHRAIDAHAGERVQLVADLLSGIDRTAEAMGAPGGRVLQEGDPVICDLVPRLNGYWGDSCTTLVLGSTGREFEQLYATVSHAMETVIETLRPGITAREFDASIRSIATGAGYEVPLHGGHGIGCANFEYPLLLPEESAVLRPGMVLMVEPGAYRAGVGGVRLEWMFLVTETGNTPLSSFALGPDVG
jgi:Xaa-Pro dipeptidase